MATATAAGLYATLLPDEPKNEPPIWRTFQHRQEGEQGFILQSGDDRGDDAQPGTVAKVELQNEDGLLVYNVVIVSPENVQEIKVDAGNGSILRVDVES